ncbi:TIGR00725 family protein [Myxacorys almedinensis]|uniref:TIGR00725 family protein n=1 Tax=Myxacorys almedinensis A TaxID=2690445 RepID=A0A8J7YZ63_9CYAN|nr:TIGR00725 family protein [Myxacorys almedinensis]NDJ17277.1 TIGR00725 family protein [Myxacorys almedinensis A]
MPKIIIGVMGASSHATPIEIQTAYALGQEIAKAGWVVLSGGRNLGVMDAVSRGAKQAGGLTIGILPHQNTVMSDAIDIPIITDMGNARNNINVLSSQAVIACGMGVGTASEVALALKANKPVILLTDDAVSQAFFRRWGGAQLSLVQTVEDAMKATRNILKCPI